MVLSMFCCAAAIFVVRAALGPYQRDNARLRHCEEHLALVRGSALDRVGWLYGTPRQHQESDEVYRKRLAMARARSFAL